MNFNINVSQLIQGVITAVINSVAVLIAPAVMWPGRWRELKRKQSMENQKNNAHFYISLLRIGRN